MNEKPRLRFPPLLMVVHSLSVIGIGVSLQEIGSTPGHSLGLIRPDMAWTVFGVCAFVDVICLFRIFSLIRRHKQMYR